MKISLRGSLLLFEPVRRRAAVRALAALAAPWIFVGCGAIGGSMQPPGAEPLDSGRGLQRPANFTAELKATEDALRRGHMDRDRGLFKIGAILAHPANSRRNPARAIQSFKTLIAEYPRSALIDPSRLWIEVLEQEQKIAEEKNKLAEEKRALHKEREILAQERQKLDFANERSRQLDLDIEKRRRKLLSQ